MDSSHNICNFAAYMKYTNLLILSFIVLTTAFSCKGSKDVNGSNDTDTTAIVQIAFNEDSAYAYCAKQCEVGPRTMNSKAHEDCKAWIAEKFAGFGLDVVEQNAQLKGYDGTMLNSTNIIAQYKPEAADRVLIFAHWDARPWADNDPDEANHKKAIDAANDGASGVAVMLELARILQKDSLKFGIDFICFDAEDWGLPSWEEDFEGNSEETWALGAQYWSKNPHKEGYKANFGILLDMVGGSGAQFCFEGYSKQYAQSVIDHVWAAAHKAGYSSFFPMKDGGIITDDHVPVISNLGIPCIDIIPYYENCEQSSFGPTWHTVNDNMNNISRETLKAVGQTLVQVLYSIQ